LTKAIRAKIELLPGTLDMLVLGVLQLGPQHGHGIGQAIRRRSKDSVRIEHGSLYPALHCLERRGSIVSAWNLSATNRRSKFYRLTKVGKEELTTQRNKWRQLVKAISMITRAPRVRTKGPSVSPWIR
jgi:PadR family transcriptional regulator, regulatory protein PadR